MKKILVWRFDSDVDRMPMQAVRLTVRTVTMRDYGEFQRLSRLGVQLWEQKFPLVEGDAGEGTELVDAVEVTEQPGDKTKQVRPYGAGVYLGIYKRWARLAPATVQVEVLSAPGDGKGKKSSEVDWDAEQDTWPWSPSSLEGLGWDKPDAMMDLPTDFFFTWERTVFDVNPGVWGGARTSDAPGAKKKTGLVALY